MNSLYYGDNLEVLAEHFPTESVDLVYLDPPFNSNVDYNVIFKEHHKAAGSTAQILAFEDTWHWGLESDAALDRMLPKNGPLAELLLLIVRTLQKNDLSAYLVMMAERLLELHRVLKDTGSLYLHCDPTASHYLKMILDVIFGARNYRNEITWKRSTAHSDGKQGRKAYGNIADVVLFYTKTDTYTFNTQYTPYTPEYLKKYGQVDPDGRRYRLDNLTGPGGAAKGNPSYEVMGVVRYWRYSREKMDELIQEGRVVQTKPGTVPQYKRYLDEMPGVPLQNVWDDIFPVNSQATERLGYPTQKPVALLERIIAVSSNPGDVVLDPFCGCGTAVAAAQKLGRQWKGIDVTHLSVALMTARLERDFGLKPGKDFQVEGTPKDAGAAQYLFERDPFQFQFWIVGLAGAQPYGATASNKKGKKGGDTGIDGLMYFRTPAGERLEKVIVSVKGGKNLNPTMLRDLVGTVQRESAAIGVFISMAEPTKGMRDEAAKAGTYKYGDRSFPKIQLLTVQDILGGKRPQIPQGAQNVSFEQGTVKTTQRQDAKTGTKSLFD